MNRLKITLRKTTDSRILDVLNNIKPRVNKLCQHLVADRSFRSLWADLINEFRNSYWVLEEITTKESYSRLVRYWQKQDLDIHLLQGYVDIFVSAYHEEDGTLQHLMAGVPEGLVYYLLNSYPESSGKAEREVSVKIDDWCSSSSERLLPHLLDVAFWDQDQFKGRGFECKTAKVQLDEIPGVVDLLASIHERTSGCLETILFVFCVNAANVKRVLKQNIEDKSTRDRLESIKFIGKEHLADFDGTTSCCGDSSQSCLPEGSTSRLTT